MSLKLAHKIFETHRCEIDKKGIAVIDVDTEKIIDIAGEEKTLSLIQILAKKYPSHRIYLLKTDTGEPVVWMR